jgi:hypothetical protein
MIRFRVPEGGLDSSGILISLFLQSAKGHHLPYAQVGRRDQFGQHNGDVPRPFIPGQGSSPVERSGVEHNCTLLWPQQPGCAAEKGSFSTTVGSHQRHHMTGRKLQ